MRKTSSNITRNKGQSGRTRSVKCAQCGALVPRDKAIAKQRYGLPSDRLLIKTLRKQGAHIHAGKRVVYYCVSYAKHRKYA